MKSLDDHCGYKLPWDPFQWLGEQDTEFHDVHHQSWGIKVSSLITFHMRRQRKEGAGGEGLFGGGGHFGMSADGFLYFRRTSLKSTLHSGTMP